MSRDLTLTSQYFALTVAGRTGDCYLNAQANTITQISVPNLGSVCSAANSLRNYFVNVIQVMKCLKSFCNQTMLLWWSQLMWARGQDEYLQHIPKLHMVNSSQRFTFVAFRGVTAFTSTTKSTVWRTVIVFWEAPLATNKVVSQIRRLKVAVCQARADDNVPLFSQHCK